jgi:hypothetical protein
MMIVWYLCYIIQIQMDMKLNKSIILNTLQEKTGIIWLDTFPVTDRTEKKLQATREVCNLELHWKHKFGAIENGDLYLNFLILQD